MAANFKVGDYVRLKEKPFSCGVIEKVGGMLLTVKIAEHTSVGMATWHWERDPSKPKDPKKMRPYCDCNKRAEVMVGGAYICRDCARIERSRRRKEVKC
jgi:hypothetical protein